MLFLRGALTLQAQQNQRESKASVCFKVGFEDFYQHLRMEEVLQIFTTWEYFKD